MDKNEVIELDMLLKALDSYATESTKTQRHLKGRWNMVVSQYAKITGMRKPAANDHLNQILYA